MAIKKTIMCDSDCGTVLNKDNGLCFRGGIFIVDDKYIEGEDSNDAEGVGGGILGGGHKDKVYHYCRRCFAKILGFDLTVKRSVDNIPAPSVEPDQDPVHTPEWPYNSPNTLSNNVPKPNWYEDK